MFAYQLMVGDVIHPSETFEMLGREHRIIEVEESDEFPTKSWHLLVERSDGTTYDRFVDLLDEVRLADEV